MRGAGAAFVPLLCTPLPWGNEGLHISKFGPDCNTTCMWRTSRNSYRICCCKCLPKRLHSTKEQSTLNKIWTCCLKMTSQLGKMLFEFTGNLINNYYMKFPWMYISCYLAQTRRRYTTKRFLELRKSRVQLWKGAFQKFQTSASADSSNFFNKTCSIACQVTKFPTNTGLLGTWETIVVWHGMCSNKCCYCQFTVLIPRLTQCILYFCLYLQVWFVQVKKQTHF